MVVRLLGKLNCAFHLRRLGVITISRFVVFVTAAVLIVTNVLTLSSEALLPLGGTLAVGAARQAR